MIEGIPKISVLVITYKQEHLIGRTLDSLIKQQDYLYEICVSDDCSPDDTWGVLLSYQNKYPDLIKLHRNSQNLGIFQNFEQSWRLPTGDIINQVSGDDMAPEGWYQTVIEYIQKNSIDYTTELFCIYGDFLIKYPNGDSRVFKNKAIRKYPNDALRLAFRNLLSNRSSCFSKRVLDKFDIISKGRSHIAEFLQDRMLQLHTEKNYYIPCVGNIYEANIGISAHLTTEQLLERKQILPYAISYLKNRGYIFNKSDLNFLEYEKAFMNFRYTHSFMSFIKSLWFYLLSFDSKLSFAGSELKELIFAIRRRLPHKNVITFK